MSDGEQLRVIVPGGIDACSDCTTAAEDEYQVSKILIKENKQRIKELSNQLKRQILMMEMDDTVGHTDNGPYFSQLQALKTELYDLADLYDLQRKVGGK
tara:strand:+ start:4391 stop:4687 length:297 start_codon:yes stop_codon:yes gene_type:complete